MSAQFNNEVVVRISPTKQDGSREPKFLSTMPGKSVSPCILQETVLPFPIQLEDRPQRRALIFTVMEQYSLAPPLVKMIWEYSQETRNPLYLLSRGSPWEYQSVKLETSPLLPIFDRKVLCFDWKVLFHLYGLD